MALSLPRGYCHRETSYFRMIKRLKSEVKEKNHCQLHQGMPRRDSPHSRGAGGHSCRVGSRSSLMPQSALSPCHDSSLLRQALWEKEEETQLCIVTVIYDICVFANEAHTVYGKATCCFCEQHEADITCPSCQ